MDNSQKLLISNLHQLPALPEVVRKLMSSFQDKNVNITTLANTIALDQGISAKVLRVANSSFYGLNREIGSIQSAVSVLGFVTLRSLVISAGTIQSFQQNAVDHFDRQQFWSRSFRVASYTEALEKSLGMGSDLSFTAGFFHDIGELVLSICIPGKFSEVLQQQQSSGLSLIEVEHAVLGFNHAEIGAEMAKRWNFPYAVERAIRFWRSPDQEPFEPIAGLVHVAVLLERGIMGEELMSHLSKAFCDRLQINWERIERCLPSQDQLNALVNQMMVKA